MVIYCLSGGFVRPVLVYLAAMSLSSTESYNDMPLLVTAAVVIEGDKVLLAKRPEGKRHAGFWEFPGGKVHPGEDPVEALNREMLEELGVGVHVGSILEVVYYRYDWGAVLILAYMCTLQDRSLRNIEVADHRWVRPAEFSEFKILPADQPILDRLIEMIS